MDKAISKLLELKEALEKAVVLPSPKTPKMPKIPSIETTPIAPKQPNLTPNSKKDSTKVAEQISDPSMKIQAIKMAKLTKFNEHGQWSL
jgi:hypothetical protein